jgi:hypothetical protein
MDIGYVLFGVGTEVLMYNSDQDCAASSIVQATLSKFVRLVGNKFNQQNVECVCKIICVLLLAYIYMDCVH